MATVTKTFSFNTATQALPYTAQGGSWAHNTNGATNETGTLDTTATYESTNDTDAGNGGLRARRTGKNQTNGTPYWEWTGAWTDLGVPSGAIVTNVNLSHDWAQPEFTSGAAGVVGPSEFYDSGGTLQATIQASAATPAAAQTTWSTRTGTTQAVPSALQAPSATIKLRITAVPKTGNSNSAAVSIGVDRVVVTVTYTPTIAVSATAGLPYTSAQLLKPTVAEPVLVSQGLAVTTDERIEASQKLTPTIVEEVEALQLVSAGKIIQQTGVVGTTGRSFQGVAAGAVTQMQAQQIVVPVGSVMTSLTVALAKVGAPSDNVVLDLRRDSAGLPDTSAGSIVNANLGTIAGSSLTTSITTYNFTPNAPIQPGTYWVVFRRDGARSTSNYYLAGLTTQVNAQLASADLDALFGASVWQAQSDDLYYSATLAQQEQVAVSQGLAVTLSEPSEALQTIQGPGATSLRDTTAQAQNEQVDLKLAGSGGIGYKTADSFTSSLDGGAFVQIRARKSGAPSDNIVFELRADSSGSPGAVLASTSVAASSFDSSFSSRVVGIGSVQAGRTYWVTISRSGAIDNSNYITLSGSNITATAKESNDGGSTWIAGGYTLSLLVTAIPGAQIATQQSLSITGPTERVEALQGIASQTKTYGRATTPTGLESASPFSAGDKRASKFTLSEAALVTSISFYTTANTGGPHQYRAGIYTDSSGSPDALIAQTPGTVTLANTAPSAWSMLALANPVLLPAGTYWLAVAASGGARSLPFVSGTGQKADINTLDTFSDGMDTPFGGSTVSTGEHFIYATYTAGPVALGEIDAKQTIASTLQEQLDALRALKNIAGDTATVLDTSSQSPGTAFQPLNDTLTYVAKDFTPSVAGKLQNVTVDIEGVGTPPSSIICEVRSDSSGNPGSVLATKYLVPTSNTRTVYSIEFTSSLVSLAAGTTYWVSFRSSGSPDTSNCWRVRANNTFNVTYNGLRTLNGGSSWSFVGVTYLINATSLVGAEQIDTTQSIATTPVTQTAQLILEALQGLAITEAEAVEALKLLAISSSTDAFEALKALAIVGPADVLEATRQLAITGAVNAYESLRALAIANPEIVDVLKQLAILGPGGAEALRLVSSADSPFDDFNRPDENPLSSDGKWTNWTTAPRLQIVGNRVAPTSTSAGAANLATWVDVVQADQWIEVDVPVLGNSGTGEKVLIMARVSADHTSYYQANFYCVEQTVHVDKVVNGSGSSAFGGFPSFSFSAGDRLGFKLTGTSMALTKNGVEVATFSDSSITGAGQVGIGIGFDFSGASGATRLDNFRVTTAATRGLTVLDAPKALAASSQESAESASSLVIPGVETIESLRPVTSNVMTAFESLQSLSALLVSPFESQSTSGLVSQTALVALEALSGISASEAGALDALQRVSGSGTLIQDLLRTITQVLQDPNNFVQYSSVVLADSPTHYWKLDETSGTTGTDSVAGLDGTYSSATINQSPLILTGRSARFTAAGQLVVPFSSDLQCNGSFTNEFWINPASNSGSQFGSVMAQGNWLFYRYTPAGRLTYRRSPFESQIAPDGVNVGVKFHIVMAYNATAHTLKSYYNGVQYRNDTGFSFASNSGTGSMSIGHGDQNGDHFLDEVAFYNYELTQSQVLAHYNAGLGTIAPVAAQIDEAAGYARTLALLADTLKSVIQTFEGD